MLYYRDFESYEGQSRHEGSDRRSGSSAEGQLVVEWLRSTPQPLDGMPQGNEEGAPRCPTVCYSKHDLYDLVDKQKKVKIDSYQALLNYRLSFTDIAAQLRISSQLSWIEKDDLFLEGFDQEFQSEILRRLKWNNRRQLLKEGYCFELREVRLARDQWSTREAQYEAEMQESRAVMAEEQCREPEKCSESARPGSKASQSSSSTSLEIQSLTRNSQNSLKLSKAPGEGLRSQVVKVDSIKSSFECIEVTSYTEDEQRVNERPIEAEAHALEVLKLVPEPRGDLCEVPERAGSVEVEETELGVEAEGQSKVVAWRKPPEAKIRRKTLKSVSWRIKEILPEFWRTHNSRMDSESWSRDFHNEPERAYAAAVEIYTSLSQKSENCLFKGYEVYEGKVKAPHSAGWSTILESTAISSTRKSTKEAALRVRTPQILYKKKWTPPCVEGEARQLREGPHLCDGHAIWSATSSFRGYKAGDQAEAKPRPPLALGTRPEPYPSWCTKVSEESNEHKTPLRLVCLLWRVFSVFLEDALWSTFVNPQRYKDIRSSKNPSKVKR
ncbi:hypothetical protein EDD16DRAFT_1524263 [Pisolithus croceorrhizus]|nr:hypothetical protein EDD16DRAFT_1524263 [Pisolithus croceorrhizus]KAI6116966.1 hypothetical protein EV401DRAFT_1889230 [Pisolithus croceorrhizus]